MEQSKNTNYWLKILNKIVYFFWSHEKENKYILKIVLEKGWKVESQYLQAAAAADSHYFFLIFSFVFPFWITGII